MIVYVDLVLLTNFLLDAALLFATAKVRRITPKRWRLFCAAALGATYSLFMFAPALTVFYTFFIKCLFSAFMIMTAFGFGNPVRFSGTLLAFYGVNTAAAGTVMALHYLMQSPHEIWNGILFSQTGSFQYAFGVTLWFVVIAGGLGIVGFRAVHASAKRKEMKGQFIAEVDVSIGDRHYHCKGLIDTGNHLYDPLTRTPVMVMETAVWQGIIPASWLKAIEAQEVDRIVSGLYDGEDEQDFPWQDRIRLVPYRGINGSTRLMLAIKPDSVVIVVGDRRMHAMKVLIGMDAGQLSSDGAYQAIIHPALVS